MGKKQRWGGKRFFLYSSCLIIFFFINCGCASFHSLEKKLLVQGYFLKAEYKTSKMEFDEALQINKKILEIAPYHPFDSQALFNICMIWLHPDNPKKNYKTSLEYLKKIEKEYPGNNKSDEIPIWIFIVSELIKKDNTINKLNKLLNDEEYKYNDLKKQLIKLKEIDIGIEEKKRKSLP